MTVRLSTGLSQAVASQQALRTALANCVIDIYSGTQPASADDAISGTYLCTVSKSAGAFTAEVKGTGVLTVGTGVGTITAVTLNGINILDSTVTTTADSTANAVAVVAALNASAWNDLVVASNVAAVITLTAVNGLGVNYNSATLATSVTASATLTVTSTSFASGTGGSVAGVAAANGLTFGAAVAGVLSKATAETWSGTASASGTAGCFRITGESSTQATRQAASTTALRIDGALATSGGDINLGSLTVTSGAPFILSTFSTTVPKV